MQGKLPPTFSTLVKHKHQTEPGLDVCCSLQLLALSPWSHNELSPSTFLYGLGLSTETAVLGEMYLIPFALPAHRWLRFVPAGCGSH